MWSGSKRNTANPRPYRAPSESSLELVHLEDDASSGRGSHKSSSDRSSDEDSFELLPLPKEVASGNGRFPNRAKGSDSLRSSNTTYGSRFTRTVGSNTKGSRNSSISTATSMANHNGKPWHANQHRQYASSTTSSVSPMVTQAQVQEAQQIARFLFQKLEQAHELLLEQERVLENRMETIRFLTYHCVRLERQLLRMEHSELVDRLPELPPLNQPPGTVVVRSRTPSPPLEANTEHSTRSDASFNLNVIQEEEEDTLVPVSVSTYDPMEELRRKHAQRVQDMYGMETSQRVLGYAAAANSSSMSLNSSYSSQQQRRSSAAAANTRLQSQVRRRMSDPLSNSSHHAQQEYVLGFNDDPRDNHGSSSGVNDLSSTVDDFLVDVDEMHRFQQDQAKSSAKVSEHEDENDAGASISDDESFANLNVTEHLHKLHHDLTTSPEQLLQADDGRPSSTRTSINSYTPSAGGMLPLQTRLSFRQGDSLMHLHMHCADLETRVKHLEALILQQQEHPTEQQHSSLSVLESTPEEEPSETTRQLNLSSSSLLEQVKHRHDEVTQSIDQASQRGETLDDLARTLREASSSSIFSDSLEQQDQQSAAKSASPELPQEQILDNNATDDNSDNIFGTSAERLEEKIEQLTSALVQQMESNRHLQEMLRNAQLANRESVHDSHLELSAHLEETLALQAQVEALTYQLDVQRELDKHDQHHNETDDSNRDASNDFLPEQHETTSPAKVDIDKLGGAREATSQMARPHRPSAVRRTNREPEDTEERDDSPKQDERKQHVAKKVTPSFPPSTRQAKPKPQNQQQQELPQILSLKDARASLLRQQGKSAEPPAQSVDPVTTVSSAAKQTQPKPRPSWASYFIQPTATATNAGGRRGTAAISPNWWERGTFDPIHATPAKSLPALQMLHVVEYIDDSDCSKSSGETVEEMLEERVVPTSRPSFNRVAAYEAGIGSPPPPFRQISYASTMRMPL